MKIIELSSKESKDGKRRVKVILHEIYKNNREYNKNGISWLKPYCQANLESIKGMSITCEFINEERTEILGHGETGIEDGVPIFENATMIGALEYGYIDDIELDGEIKTVCIAEGYLDAMRYKNFIDVLERKHQGGETIYGSVEIIGLKENQNRIEYQSGYKEKGRIPVKYRYSGFAILGIEPSDSTSRLLEINSESKIKNRKENSQMEDFKPILEEIKSKIDETSACKKMLEENQKTLETTNAEKDNLLEKLEILKNENESLKNALDESKQITENLEKELQELKTKSTISELEESLKEFTDEQKKVAEKEIEELKSDPINSGVKTENIVQKILADIGKKVLEKQSEPLKEQNSFMYRNNDILGEVFETNSKTFSIF